MVEELGKRLGVKLSASKIAINPFKGAVVLSHVKASSSHQGDFLTVDRLEVVGDPNSEAQEVQSVDIDGASLDLDLSRPGLTDLQKVGQHQGSVRRTTIRNLSVTLRVGGAQLLAGQGLVVKSSGVRICPAGGDLPVCGGLELTEGDARLAGGSERVTKLTLAGSFEGHRLKLDAFDGELGGGRFTCAGDAVLFEPSPRKGIDLRCRLDRVHLIRGEVLDLVVSGEVRLSGPPGGLKLTGSLEAQGGERLRGGTWGETGADGPLDVTLTVLVKAPRGRATARVSWSDGLGRVTLVGTNARDPAAAERLLEQLRPVDAAGVDRP
jgi:hypothetical protein